MKSKAFLSLLLSFILGLSYGQFFQGEIEYNHYYLDKQTMKPLFDFVPEIVTIKEAKYKALIPNAQKGQLEWRIDNYNEGITYSRKSYRNADYIISDKEPTIAKDGSLMFHKPDSQQIAPIMKDTLCSSALDTLSKFIKLDTTFLIKGLSCEVIVESRNGITINEYYYHTGIKLNPAFYKCNRIDGLDKLYKLTNGSLIVQLVYYDELFTCISQVQVIRDKVVNDSEFIIPSGIKIEPIR
jgi:hypothetical protein